MQARASSRAVVASASAAVGTLASALWFGGIVTLGAVAAPLVFRVVPAPTSADAMGLVFRRFDRVALVCAVVVLVAEVVRAFGHRAASVSRVALARVGVCLVGAAFALWQATALSPRILALHAQGAIRGYGDAGLELEAVHHLAELSGKAQAFSAMVLLVLFAAAPRERAASSAL